MRLAIVLVVACGGSSGTGTTSSPKAVPDGDAFAPLEVGADYETFRKLSTKPFLSLDHGSRWVEVYVNEIGADAYEAGAAIPVGTVVVKASWEDVEGHPSSTPGPIYVMHKRPAGYAPAHDDWWYAIHWAGSPAPEGPIYWRGKSERVDYCSDCHDSYDRSLGGLIPSSILKR